MVVMWHNLRRGCHRAAGTAAITERIALACVLVHWNQHKRAGPGASNYGEEREGQRSLIEQQRKKAYKATSPPPFVARVHFTCGFDLVLSYVDGCVRAASIWTIILQCITFAWDSG